MVHSYVVDGGDGLQLGGWQGTTNSP